MSIFSSDSHAPVLRDSTVVQHFRFNPPTEYLTRLNLDLGLSLTAEEFLRIQDYFKKTALRDPTVGELRLLDAVVQRDCYTADRVAVGELITVSPALAETWADMMAKRRGLNGSSSVSRTTHKQISPCSLVEALDLTGHYLYRMDYRAPEDTVLLSAPHQEAVAAAEGYRPVARIRVGDGFRSLWQRRTPVLEETPCRSGDMLLYLPSLTLKQVEELVASEAGKPHSAIGAIRAVARGSLLTTVLDLCPAASLHAARLADEGQSRTDIPFPLLCKRSTVQSDGTCGYLLRVPQKRMTEATLLLQEKKLSFIPCGQARLDGNLVILLPDVRGLGEFAAVSLPAELLRSMSLPRLYSMTPSATDAPIDRATCPPLVCLPTADREADGLTPDGRETLALTLSERGFLCIPEANTGITVLTAEVPVTDSAYSAAAEATASAALALEREGIPPSCIRLSVAVTVASHAMLTEGPALSAICGVYCAAAQLAVPVEDSVVETSPSAVPLTITVTAWGKAPQPLPVGDDRQWHTAPTAGGQIPLGYTLPVLRRVREGSLRALSAALSSQQPLACTLRPLAVHTVTNRETGESGYRLHPGSLQKLLSELNSSLIPVIALSRDDTLLLFSHPEVADALQKRAEKGSPILVLGEACEVFAQYGLLPAALSRVHALPRGGHTAAVAYSFPTRNATRLLRADPLAAADSAAAEAPHLLELTLPDGTLVPDGFIREGSRTLGLLNGPDTAVLDYIRQLGFTMPASTIDHPLP